MLSCATNFERNISPVGGVAAVGLFLMECADVTPANSSKLAQTRIDFPILFCVEKKSAKMKRYDDESVDDIAEVQKEKRSRRTKEARLSLDRKRRVSRALFSQCRYSSCSTPIKSILPLVKWKLGPMSLSGYITTGIAKSGLAFVAANGGNVLLPLGCTPLQFLAYSLALLFLIASSGFGSAERIFLWQAAVSHTNMPASMLFHSGRPYRKCCGYVRKSIGLVMRDLYIYSASDKFKREMYMH
ncbi:hypothetical protein RB195_010168 [Necator americanus]|uniref:Amino acid permease/ SLC12A domain-containing protein n=1 Tax=Necator americanus TaxID=51031 RepID=A0ABR1CWS8_NECAM